jgi:hypothetical protein
MSDAEAVQTPEPPSKEELKKAMKAFRKRLKVRSGKSWLFKGGCGISDRGFMS